MKKILFDSVYTVAFFVVVFVCFGRDSHIVHGEEQEGLNLNNTHTFFFLLFVREIIRHFNNHVYFCFRSNSRRAQQNKKKKINNNNVMEKSRPNVHYSNRKIIRM